MATDRELIEYFLDYPSGKWGDIYEDDKYFDDTELMDSFINFYTYAYAHQGLPRPTRAQYEMAYFMANNREHRMVMCMRGLGKSLSAELYVVWRLLNDPDEHILVMSAGRERASNFSQFTQKLIKMLPITKPMSPRTNIERTSGSSFDVAGASASDSPSVYAVGAATQVTGFRATLIIYDDIETANTVESVVKTEAINTYAMEAQNLLMSGRDESLVLCTPHSMNSIYISWIQEKGFKPFAIPAYYPQDQSPYFGGLAPFIVERIEKDPSVVGTPVDDRINAEFLEKRKLIIGKSKFKLQYMLDVSESDDLRFPLKLRDLIVTDVDEDMAPLKYVYSSMNDKILRMKLHGFSKDRVFLPAWESQEREEYDFRVMAIDPSGSGTDEIGVAIIYHLNGRLFLKRITGLQGGYDDDTLGNIATLCKLHRIHSIVIEDNYGDGAFRKMLEPHVIKENPTTSIEGVKVTGQKEIRIIDILEPILNQHRLIVDKSTLEEDYYAPSKAYSFTYQLSHLTKERGCLQHDDRLDALSLGVKFMLEWMVDDIDRGYEYHLEKEAQKTLEYTLQLVQGFKRRARRNYAERF